jgi:hypothetical protein
MFGKRPQAAVLPRLIPQVPQRRTYGGEPDAILLVIELFLRNESSVIARSPYCTVELAEYGGPKVSLQSIDVGPLFQVSNATLRDTSLISKDGVMLAPRGSLKLGTLYLELRGVLDRALEILICAGCEGAPPFLDRYRVEPEELGRGLATIREALDPGPPPDTRDFRVSGLDLLRLAPLLEVGGV